jgi:hypothetical protein
MLVASPTTFDIEAALRGFLAAILPPIDVVLGPVNRVPEPIGVDFVVMIPLHRPRLATNVDVFADAAYTGSIAGGVLTVAAVQVGAILPAATLFGQGVAFGTVVGSQISGPTGGVGTYSVSPSQTVASTQLASGANASTQETEIVYQIDVHGPASGDNAQIISTMLRDARGVDLFAATGLPIAPLYGDDPRQMTFIDGEQQSELRWVVDAHLQANITVARIPQQGAGTVQLTVVSVDAAFPP